MTMVILGLSIDFYLLCLVSLTHSTFETYCRAGIFRDLHVAGVRPWDAIQPLVQVLIVLVLGDVAVESMVAVATNHDPVGFALFGISISVLYAIVAALFTSCLITFMNLRRLPLLIQFFITLGYSFAALLVISSLSEMWEPAFRSFDSPGWWNAITAVTHASWSNFASAYAYYAAFLAEGVVLGLLSIPFYGYVRKLSATQFANL